MNFELLTYDDDPEFKIYPVSDIFVYEAQYDIIGTKIKSGYFVYACRTKFNYIFLLETSVNNEVYRSPIQKLHYNLPTLTPLSESELSKLFKFHKNQTFIRISYFYNLFTDYYLRHSNLKNFIE